MRKLLIGLTVLVLGVAFMVPGLAQKPIPVSSAMAKSDVVWRVPGFIELKVSTDNFVFPEFDPGIDEYLAENAVTLYVFSNVKWSLSFSLEGADEAIAHLSVILSQDEGKGNDIIPVDYKLSNLREMAPGTYEVTVVYTATAE